VLAPVDSSVLEALRSDLGDDEAVRRVAAIYVAGLPEAREQLAEALANGDHDALRQGAHRLRTSSAAFGAKRLAKLCEAVERDSAGAPPELIAEMDVESRRVEDALQGEL
jgi:HPt (histidine-containing phosphotransfer) domain-containing protein